jgi:hypothetical protein
LSKALKEAARFDLIVRNVATTERPPKVDGDEIQIIDQARLGEMLTKLKGRAIYPNAITSLFTGRCWSPAAPWPRQSIRRARPCRITRPA